jgi:oxygen-dependent protoporphyrinogen oxidase
MPRYCVELPWFESLAGNSDSEVVDLFTNGLYEIFPESKGLVTEASLHRWEKAAPYSHPGRAGLQRALERPLGRIVLAGDYLGTFFTETSVRSALSASELIGEGLVADRAVSTDR